MIKPCDQQHKVTVAIYVRVSTQMQIDRDSLPVQRKELIAYAELMLNANGYTVFEDAGFSAKNTDRPAYQEMMNRIRSKEFTHLLVWKLDRISRNLLDFSAMYEELKQLNVVFISKNEQFDTSSAMGEAMLKIILVFAELERKMTSERVSAVLTARAAEGKWNGGRVPFGYSHDKEADTFDIIPDEAETVQAIFSLYEEYQSAQKVAQILNEHQRCTRNGKPWRPETVYLILTKRFYTGTYLYNHFNMSKRCSRQDVNPESEWVIVPNHHPAIISEERWQAVCELLHRNSRGGFKAKNFTYVRKNVHVFSGLIICGSCGGNFGATPYGRVMDSGYRPSTYACMNRRKGKFCKNKYTNDIEFAPFVLRLLANIVRAQSSFTRSTTEAALQKKLLLGKELADVAAIEPDSLHSLYAFFQSHLETGFDIVPLSTPFLNNLESQVSVISKISASGDSENTYAYKASFFLLMQKLADPRFTNFDALFLTLDKKMLKDFMNETILHMKLLQGRVTEITFRNEIVIIPVWTEK